MNLDKQLKLLAKINGINERLVSLKKQGEGSKKKTLKSMRTRRNRTIKELVNLLQPSTSFYDELNKEKQI